MAFDQKSEHFLETFHDFYTVFKSVGNKYWRFQFPQNLSMRAYLNFYLQV